MPETIYNLFAYTDGKVISDVGIVPYKIVDECSDEDKIKFLRERCLIDHVNAYKGRIVSPEITLETYFSKLRLGTFIELFEELLQLEHAPPDPLVVMTFIENGEAKVEYSYKGASLDLSKSSEGFVDYLVHYTSEAGIDFMQMFEDDYFKAIKLLFNNGFLVSSTKLLMIFVDTVAFVEFGNENGSFSKWLDTYVMLGSIGLKGGLKSKYQQSRANLMMGMRDLVSILGQELYSKNTSKISDLSFSHPQ